MKPKPDVGIILYNNNGSIDNLVEAAVPIVEEIFEKFYGANVDVHVEKSEDEARIYAYVPEPNGQSMEFLAKLDRGIYVPLIENGLGAEGYVPFIGDKKIEDIWGYAALAEIFAKGGKKKDATRMSSLFTDGMERYGIIKKKSAS